VCIVDNSVVRIHSMFFSNDSDLSLWLQSEIEDGCNFGSFVIEKCSVL
jgi:hypothetical protein